MATNTRASKNDQRTTLLFVLSLTVGGEKKKAVSNKAFKTNLKQTVIGTEVLHRNHGYSYHGIASVPEGLCSLRDEIWELGGHFSEQLEPCYASACFNLNFGHTPQHLSLFHPPSKRPGRSFWLPNRSHLLSQLTVAYYSLKVKWGISTL